MQKIGTLVLIVLTALLTVQPARSQQPRDGAPRAEPSVTAAQARQALEVLQDDNKRGQLIQTLQTIAKTSSPAAPASPSPAASEDNLGVQVMVQVSNWFGEVSTQLANAARAATNFPMLLHWSIELAKDPVARHTLLDTAWKLALVIVCALAIEWIVWRALRKPLAAIERYVPVRARPARQEADRGDAVPQDLGHELRRHRSLAYAYQLVLRLPFVLARLTLELTPVLAFAALGNLLLATEIGSDATPRVIILAVVNAYVLCRVVLCATGALVSPAANQPSLFVIRDENAAYINIWARRIVVVAVFAGRVTQAAADCGIEECRCWRLSCRLGRAGSC